MEPAFSAIGRTHGPFDLLLVPIGAYEPRELVAHMHANPEEAAQIASEVEARLAIGIHWGTFALSPDRTRGIRFARFMEAGRRDGREHKGSGNRREHIGPPESVSTVHGGSRL